MSVAVGPIFTRTGADWPTRTPSKTPANSQGLRLPEERAFDVATINHRLASLAEAAAPAGVRRPPKP